MLPECAKSTKNTTLTTTPTKEPINVYKSSMVNSRRGNRKFNRWWYRAKPTPKEFNIKDERAEVCKEAQNILVDKSPERHPAEIEVLMDGTIQVKCKHGSGEMYIRSKSKDGWTTIYGVSGAKEAAYFKGANGLTWFTWYFVGEAGNERGVMKIYHEGDGVHPMGMVEWYKGEKGHEELYCRSDGSHPIAN